MSDLDNRLYRVQLADENVSPYYNRHAPIKRVSVSAQGDIEFNPDEMKFIYFSKTMKHHTYYMYNKFIQMINDELKYAKGRSEYSKLGLPKNLSKLLPTNYNALKYYNINSNILKNLQCFFKDYLPPKYVELVSLKYIDSFGVLLDDCIVRNSKKQL